METDTAEQLLELLVEETGVDRKQINAATVLSSLVTDSLETVNLISEIEYRFGIEFNSLGRETTFGAVVEMIEAKA